MLGGGSRCDWQVGRSLQPLISFVRWKVFVLEFMASESLREIQYPMSLLVLTKTGMRWRISGSWCLTLISIFSPPKRSLKSSTVAGEMRGSSKRA